MKSRTITSAHFGFFVLLSMTANSANSYASADIVKRYPGITKTPEETTEAKMQGECLVDLKELN